MSALQKEYREKVENLCGHEDLLTFFQLRKSHEKLTSRGEALEEFPIATYLKDVIKTAAPKRRAYPIEFEPGSRGHQPNFDIKQNPSLLGSLLGNYEPPAYCSIRPLTKEDIITLDLGVQLDPIE